MSERRIQPGHVHAARVLGPLCGDIARALRAEYRPTSDDGLPLDVWLRSWLHRLGEAVRRLATGIECLGDAAESGRIAGDAGVDAALMDIHRAIRALIVLHDEAGLTDMAPDTALRDDLMDVTADAMRQIRAFLLRYVDAVQHPDSIAGLHLELTLDLHPSPKLDAVIARMRVCSSASVVPNASSPKRSAEITRMPYSGYGKPRQPCRTDGDLLFAGLIGLALGIYLGGD